MRGKTAMIEIECPECNGIRKMSLIQRNFTGPYRCWKCRRLFTISIVDNRVQSFTPLSEEEFNRWQQEQDALKQQQDS
jgi:hypothetical protein